MDTTLRHTLHERGLRLTPQRQLVLDAIRALGHATPEQICARVQEAAPAVNITTVYRTLELLEELGLVTHAHLSHGATTYHGVAGEQHVHLVCRSCNAIEEVPATMLATLADEIEGSNGFLVDIGHVALFGVCAHCGGKE